MSRISLELASTNATCVPWVSGSVSSLPTFPPRNRCGRMRKRHERSMVSVLSFLGELQGISRGRIEGLLDHLQVGKLLVHRGPAFGIHLTELCSAGIVPGY